MWSEDVRIRRVAKGDGPALERFYAELSTRSRSLQFHGQCPSIGATRAEDLAAADHRRRDGFVAVAGETIVGHLMLEPDGEATEEMAVAVSDRFQGHGVGTLLVAAGNASGRLRGSGASSPGCCRRTLRCVICSPVALTACGPSGSGQCSGASSTYRLMLARAAVRSDGRARKDRNALVAGGSAGPNRHSSLRPRHPPIRPRARKDGGPDEPDLRGRGWEQAWVRPASAP